MQAYVIIVDYIPDASIFAGTGIVADNMHWQMTTSSYFTTDIS